MFRVLLLCLILMGLWGVKKWDDILDKYLFNFLFKNDFRILLLYKINIILDKIFYIGIYKFN